jgi:alkylation response protein AidB-like acyl-CoA dehydrogenase
MPSSTSTLVRPPDTGFSPDEEAMLREAVAGIVGAFGHDYFAERSATEGGRATELWEALAAGGYAGANIPEEWGGGGLGLSALAAVAEETAAAGSPLIMLIISPAIIGSILARSGTDEQKDRWLRGIGSGQSRIAFGITEPDAGSNTHNISTKARRDGDKWILNGAKTYISAFDECDAILVCARTGTDERTGRAQLSLFMVDADAAGIEKQPIPMWIQMPDVQYSVFFDNVEIDADRMVGEEGRGLRAVFDGLNPERVIIASLSAGMGRYAIDKAVAYAKERQVWDVPIGAHQGIAHPLAEAKINLELARLAIQRAANLYDAGMDAGEASNIAKFAAAEAGVRCLDIAIETHGGNGFASEYGLGELHGLARLFKTVPITREMILNFVAEHTLGLPKSY